MPIWLSHLATIAATTLAAVPAFSQYFDSATVDPFDARSPSGSYVLHVDPSDRYGWAAARYTLARDGKELWTKELDCTLQKIVVGDDGVTAGSAQRRVEAGGFELVLMLLAKDGTPAFQQILPPEPGYMHGPEFPYAAGNVLLPERDCVVFRAVHYDRNRSERDTYEEWRAVSCSSGKEFATFVPANQLAEQRGVFRFASVRPIQGTALIAAQALILDYGQLVHEQGATFAVFGLDGKPVWERREAIDYVVPDDEEASDALWRWVCGNGALLDCSEPGRFEFALAREGQRVLCEVKSDPAQADDWIVNEVRRSEYRIPFENEEPKAKSYPPFSLELVGTIELQGGDPTVERVWNFDLDGQGRLGAIVTAESKPPRFVLRDPVRGFVADFVLDLAPVEEEPSRPGLVWLKGNRWLIYTNQSGDEDSRAHAWWLDLPGGLLTEIQDFECAPIDKADGTLDGGFVALTSKMAEYTIIRTLSSFDAEGRLRWEDTEAYGQSEDGLFSPEGLAFSPKGEVCVLDNIKKVIQRFDLAGKLTSEIDLEQALGRELRYPTDLGVDPDGNWVVYDFNGSPPVLKVTREARLTASFTPAYDDGRTFYPPGGIRVAPDGSLWASDSYALVRLDKSGVVDRVAGEPPTESTLGDVECGFIDPTGRILLVDARTHAVHVFDAEGKRLAICKLGPEAAQDISWVAVAPDLTIHVGPVADEAQRYRKFAPNGVPLGGEAFNGAIHFQPATGRRWELHGGKLRLVSAEGKELAQQDHAPDGRWLDSSDDCAVDQDGSLVLSSREGYHLFTPDGAPDHSLPIPFQAGWANLALSDSYIFSVGNAQVWRTDRKSGAVQQATLELGDPNQARPIPAWHADTGELWLADLEAKKVFRYRVKD